MPVFWKILLMQEMNDTPCLRAGIFWINRGAIEGSLGCLIQEGVEITEIWTFFWKLISEGVLFNKGWEICIKLTYFALIKKASVFYV